MFFSFTLRTTTMACLLAGLPLAGGAAWAEPSPPSSAAVHTGTAQPVQFSAEQVAHGAQIYAASCATCHGEDLAGGHDVPDLGSYFVARWANTPLDRLAGYIAHAMPLTAPGSLPPQDTAALVAFLLQRNGVTSATNAPLPMEDARLAKIRFPAVFALPPAIKSRP